ncbi:hypothetical protein [Georgenia sp. AZ-5]|uniref:CBU_0592 family membrane protein n=1 Tax=Georgenia sp. AZ-5 TaxID=3367526 RepID=UPI003754E0C7
MNDLATSAVTVLGWTGALVSLGTYIAVTQRKLATDTVRYQALNIFGAGTLGISALVNGALPSAVVNIIWIFIGVLAVLAMKRGVIAARLAAEARRHRRLAQAGRARLAAGRDHLARAGRATPQTNRPLQPGSARPAGRASRPGRRQLTTRHTRSRTHTA